MSNTYLDILKMIKYGIFTNLYLRDFFLKVDINDLQTNLHDNGFELPNLEGQDDKVEDLLKKKAIFDSVKKNMGSKERMKIIQYY